VAVTVVDPPRLTELPLIVIALLVSELLPMLDSVLVEPDIVVPAKVVSVPPSANEVLPMVTVLFVSELLPIFDRVLVDPEIDVPVKVAIVPPNETAVLPIVIELLARLALPIAMVVLVTPVTTPLALTAKTGTLEAEPYVFAETPEAGKSSLTIARNVVGASGPDVGPA
jgi:hypothetical protein